METSIGSKLELLYSSADHIHDEKAAIHSCSAGYASSRKELAIRYHTVNEEERAGYPLGERRKVQRENTILR